MLFNSLSFLIFLPIVFICYWTVNKQKLYYQNLLLLIASYVFYGWWDVRFLSLIFVSSVVDYFVGRQLDLEKRASQRKLLLTISILTNLGILGFFKYAGFFVSSFADLLNAFGFEANLPFLSIILPVGISFYTFQTMSYTIDIYRRKFSPTNNFIAFLAFVSFFPQLVAGPIERAKNLLPQFLKSREFEIEKAKDGLRQMLWGLFKKIVIADNAAVQVNYVYSNYTDLSGFLLILATFLFAIQIYCDFSGYSDIAIGTARLFGFSLMRNFAFPYFSRDIAEFWRRWHISLSSWFRDYVYIPLGGNRGNRNRTISNLVITFTVSGFWHGANWTFIFWGLLNGLYYLPLMFLGRQKNHTNIVAENSKLPSVGELIQILLTFFLVLFAWIFFRAESLSYAFHFISKIIYDFYILIPPGKMIVSIFYSFVVIAIEWFQRTKKHGLEIDKIPVYYRWTIYLLLVNAILFLGNLGRIQFIYFQF